MNALIEESSLLRCSAYPEGVGVRVRVRARARARVRVRAPCCSA